MALARRETRAIGRRRARARAGAEEKVAGDVGVRRGGAGDDQRDVPGTRERAVDSGPGVSGDIEVWQFLVLTAGYFIGIEIYLDKKYDDNNKTVMPSVPKEEGKRRGDERGRVNRGAARKNVE